MRTNLARALSPETEALANNFAEFLAEKARRDGDRRDSVAYLERPLSPLEEMFGIGTRYDSKTLRSDAQAFVTKALPRADAAFSAMFARQLEYVYTWTADIEYPALKARSLVPVDTEVPSGAEFFTYSMYDVAGEAAILQNYAKNSFPEADVYADQFRQAVKGLGAKYSFSVQDMRAAAMAGVPLEAKKASSARYSVEKRLERIAAYGDAPTGIYGITNAPGITATTKLSPAGTWAQQIAAAIAAGTLPATSQAILGDVNAQAQGIYNATLGEHTPTTLVLPTAAFSILATTPWSPVYRDESILQFILKSSPWLDEIVDWPYLNTIGRLPLAGTFHVINGSASVVASVSQAGVVYVGATLYLGGVAYVVSAFNGTTGITLSVVYAGSTNVTLGSVTQQSGLSLVYEKDPRVLQLVIPQEFEQFPPEMDGLLWEVYCHLRTGGVNVIRPLAVTTMAGIS
jgi:hypothetical protein